MTKAQDALMMILDDHIADHDYLALYRFETATHLVFPLTLVGPVRAQLRQQAHDACWIQGTTALYDVSQRGLS